MFFRSVGVGLVLLALGATTAGAAPTPVPGGANGVQGLSAKLGSTVFNGDLRITISGLRDATDEETKAFLPNDGEKVMVFTALLRNGTHAEFTDLVRYTLADKDDISVEIADTRVHPANVHIQQGAAVRQQVIFAVDKDFTPVKLLVQCATCGAHSGFRVVRFTIPSS